MGAKSLKNFLTGNDSGIFSGLTLSIVEISRDSDDSVGDFLAKVSFSNLLHFTQNHSRNFLWSKHLGALGGLYLDVWLGILLNHLF